MFTQRLIVALFVAAIVLVVLTASINQKRMVDDLNTCTNTGLPLHDCLQMGKQVTP